MTRRLLQRVKSAIASKRCEHRRNLWMRERENDEMDEKGRRIWTDVIGIVKRLVTCFTFHKVR